MKSRASFSAKKPKMKNEQHYALNLAHSVFGACLFLFLQEDEA
jgi:hypothetical protein